MFGCLVEQPAAQEDVGSGLQVAQPVAALALLQAEHGGGVVFEVDKADAAGFGQHHIAGEGLAEELVLPVYGFDGMQALQPAFEAAGFGLLFDGDEQGLLAHMAHQEGIFLHRQ